MGHKVKKKIPVFNLINSLILLVFALVTILPFIHIIAVSFASPVEAITKDFLLFPTKFSIASYETLLDGSTVPRALLVSALITIMGTLLSLLISIVMAYPLSIKGFRGKSIFMFLIVFTMIFRSGIIPNYMVIMKLGLINNILAVLLPMSVNAFYLIIMINFFREIPMELREAAKIDGSNEMTTLMKIVLPLSKPIIASLGLFFAVGFWNCYLQPMLYLNNPKMWPIQIILRQMVLLSEGLTQIDDPDMIMPPSKTIKSAVIVVGTLPILCVYPFVQKHFAKGILLGSVKG